MAGQSPAVYDVAEQLGIGTISGFEFHQGIQTQKWGFTSEISAEPEKMTASEQ